MKADSAYVSQVVSTPEYDYLSEINGAARTSTSRGHSRPSLSPRDTEAMKFFGFLLILLILVLIVWSVLKKVDFTAAKEETKGPGLGKDTIYGHDWDKEIDQLMRDAQYGEAIVLAYLRWLKRMADNGAVKFHKSKTPGIFLAEARQYADALPPEEKDKMLAKAQTLTNQYLLVRYGHRQPSLQLAQEMISL